MWRIAAFACALLFLSFDARALNTWGTDMSDLWWNPAENGWGANVTHQRDTIFMTLFVYGPDRSARWYSASDMRGTTTPQGGYVFQGQLFETTGPHFGGPFNASAVPRLVGTATLTFPSVERGTLAYSVDGVSVTKSIERLSMKRAEISGFYVGGIVGGVSGCGPASSFAYTGNFSIGMNPSNNNIAMSVTLQNGASCSYIGTYSQFGRMGAITGTFTCLDTAPGTFTASEIEAGTNMVSMRYVARYGACTETGVIGGMKF
jgi:hypothetical protein